jgi:hypothetical protein
MVESLLKEFPNVLTLRVRMPIVADLTYERNFITKIIKYDKVRAGSIQLHRSCGAHDACFSWEGSCFQAWRARLYVVAATTTINDWLQVAAPHNACLSVSCLLQVIDIPNSMTVLPELIPYSLEMVCGNRGLRLPLRGGQLQRSAPAAGRLCVCVCVCVCV